MPKSRNPSIATLVDVLKTQSSKPYPRDWSAFEDHVRQVYQALLDIKGENISVSRDMIIQGRDGLKHQIDVYYEFELVGLRHRIAIECKNTGRPIEKDEILAFSAKIRDCPGVRGCFVAVNGYQSGAKQFAERNDITAITLADLPSIGGLLGLRLEHVAIPTEDGIGQPFWTLYDGDDAVPYSEKNSDGYWGFLFFSKQQAQSFKTARHLPQRWVVRGLSQLNLRTYILLGDFFASRFLIARPEEMNELSQRSPINIVDGSGFLFNVVERNALISTYYLGPDPTSKEPFVAPGFQGSKDP
jgi:Restriction endonuclease